MRRRLMVLVLGCALAGALVLPAIGTAAHHGPTVVGCSHGFTAGFDFRSHPTKCKEFDGHAHNRSTITDLIRLRWHNWGHGQATANGRWYYCCVDGHGTGPAHVVVFRKRFRCGHWAYTRLTAHLDFPHNQPGSTNRFHLVAC